MQSAAGGMAGCESSSLCVRSKCSCVSESKCWPAVGLHMAATCSLGCPSSRDRMLSQGFTAPKWACCPGCGSPLDARSCRASQRAMWAGSCNLLLLSLAACADGCLLAVGCHKLLLWPPGATQMQRLLGQPASRNWIGERRELLFQSITAAHHRPPSLAWMNRPSYGESNTSLNLPAVHQHCCHTLSTTESEPGLLTVPAWHTIFNILALMLVLLVLGQVTIGCLLEGAGCLLRA